MTLPDDLGPHRVHLRDYYVGVRNGTITCIGTGVNQITPAQFTHVMADLMLAVALSMPWTYDEPAESAPEGVGPTEMQPGGTEEVSVEE